MALHLCKDSNVRKDIRALRIKQKIISFHFFPNSCHHTVSYLKFTVCSINTQGAGRIKKKISKVMQASDFTLGLHNCLESSQ